jgi:hypothetical protein
VKDWAVALIAAVFIATFVVWGTFIIFWAMK